MAVSIGAVAIPDASDGQAWFDSIYRPILFDTAKRKMGILAKMFGAKTPEESTGTFGGEPARIFRWRVPGGDPRVYAVMRRGILTYGMIVTDEDEKAELAASRVRFLE